MTKSQKLNVSLLPVLILVVLIGGAGYLLFKGDIKVPWFHNGDSVQARRLDGFPTVVTVAVEGDNKLRRVIKSQDELLAFLKEVDPSGNLALGEKINFDNEFLIGAASKTTNTEGYTLKVKKVYINKKDNSLLVQLAQEEPGDDCQPAQGFTVPVDLVAINKTSKEITFDIVKSKIDCEKSETPVSGN